MPSKARLGWSPREMPSQATRAEREGLGFDSEAQRELSSLLSFPVLKWGLRGPTLPLVPDHAMYTIPQLTTLQKHMPLPMVLGLSIGGSQRHPGVMESPIPNIPSMQFSLEGNQAKCHEQSMGSTQDAPKLGPLTH